MFGLHKRNAPHNIPDPDLPPVAYHTVPRPGFFGKLLKLQVTVPLPQHYPQDDRDNGKNFDMYYLLSIGALKEDRSAESIRSGIIVDQAGAIVLRNFAEQAHRQETQPPQNLS